MCAEINSITLIGGGRVNFNWSATVLFDTRAYHIICIMIKLGTKLHVKLEHQIILIM